MTGFGQVLWVEKTDRDFGPLRQSLSIARFRLARSESVAEAIEVLTSLPIDVVVIDPELPDGRGLAAVRLLREQAPDVVLVSPLIDAASEGVDWIKAARTVGIRSAACIASWDNLTNKGLMRIEPALVVVWNETHDFKEVTVRAEAGQTQTVRLE